MIDPAFAKQKHWNTKRIHHSAPPVALQVHHHAAAHRALAFPLQKPQQQTAKAVPTAPHLLPCRLTTTLLSTSASAIQLGKGPLRRGGGQGAFE